MLQTLMMPWARSRKHSGAKTRIRRSPHKSRRGLNGLELLEGRALLAGVVLPNLPAGSKYQIAFVTAGTRMAASADINNYNAYVSTEASLSPSLPQTTWRAWVSTPTTNAKDNAPAFTNVPIYNTRGELIASDPNAFFFPTHRAPIGFDQFGIQGNRDVWTGSDYRGLGIAGSTAGSGTAQFGRSWDSGTSLGWVSAGSTYTTDYGARSLYALSGVLTIGGTVASPSAPSGLVALPGNRSVALSWNAPIVRGDSAISDYVIQFSSNGGATWTAFNRTASNATSATVTGLTNGTPYVFRVAAVNRAGAGAFTPASVSVTPLALASPPVGVVLPNLPAGSRYQIAFVTAGTRMAASADISVYNAYVSTEASLSPSLPQATWRAWVSTGTMDAVSWVNAKDNAPTYADVPIYNTRGELIAANSREFLFPTHRAAIGFDQFGILGNRDVWTGSDYRGQGIFTRTAGASQAQFGRSLNSGTSLGWSSADATYTTDYGARSLYALSGVLTIGGTVTRPSAPSGLVAVPSNGAAALSWNAPIVRGDSAISDYVIQFSSNGGATWTAFNRTASNATSATVTGLTNGTPYVFRVAAVNRAGAGAFTPASVSVTPLALASPPVGVVLPNLPAGSRYQIAFVTAGTRMAASADISVYNAYVSTEASLSPSLPQATWRAWVSTGTMDAVSWVNAKDNAPTYADVPIYNTRGELIAANSREFLFPTHRAAIGFDQFGILGNRDVWTGSDYRGQGIFTRTAGASQAQFGRSLNSGTSLGWSSADATYTTDYGARSLYALSGVLTIGGSVTRPSIPSGLVALPSNGSTALSWNAPTAVGDSAISDYVIQFSSNGGTTWTTFNRTSSNATSATVTGLTNGTPYVFRVAAVNRAGAGAFTPALMPATPGLSSSPSATVVLPNLPAGSKYQIVFLTAGVRLAGSADVNEYNTYVNAEAKRSPSLPQTTWRAWVSTPTAQAKDNAPVFADVPIYNTRGELIAANSREFLFPTHRAAIGFDQFGILGNRDVWTGSDYRGQGIFTRTLGSGQAQYGRSLDSGTSLGWSSADATYTTDYGARSLYALSGVLTIGGTVASPSAPINLVGRPSNGQVILSWTAPASNGGSAITDYIVQYRASNAASWITVNDGRSASTSAAITGLTNGTSYLFRVAAVNAAGNGPFTATTVKATPVLTQDAVVGRWNWFNGESYEFLADGQIIRYFPDRTIIYRSDASWRRPDANTNRYLVTWGNGQFRDDLLLLFNAGSLRGSNQYGTVVTGLRPLDGRPAL
jgi:large repetitive protein